MYLLCPKNRQCPSLFQMYRDQGLKDARPLVPSLFGRAFKPAIKPTSSLPLPEEDEASLGARKG